MVTTNQTENRVAMLQLHRRSDEIDAGLRSREGLVGAETTALTPHDKLGQRLDQATMAMSHMMDDRLRRLDDKVLARQQEQQQHDDNAHARAQQHLEDGRDAQNKLWSVRIDAVQEETTKQQQEHTTATKAAHAATTAAAVAAFAAEASAAQSGTTATAHLGPTPLSG